MKTLLKKKSFVLTLAILMILLPAFRVLAYSTGYPNTWTNTGNQANDIAGIAKTQVGYSETSTNHTKYNAWYYGSDTAAPWCGIFISWCANQADVPTSTLRKNALASGYSVKNMSCNSFGAPAYAFGSTTARIGDIIYVDNTGNGVSNHVGLVVDVDDTYIYTVEGNSSSKVSNVRYLVEDGRRKYNSYTSSARIVFFARPSYKKDASASTAPASSSSSSASTDTSYATGNYKVTAEELHVRSGPDTTYSSLGVLPKGTVIKVTKTSDRFGCFSYHGKTAWTSLKYCTTTTAAATDLSTISSSSQAASDYPTGTYRLDNDMVVRSGPDTSYSALGELQDGTKVTITKTNGRFGCFSYNGKTAWVSLKYATKVNSTASASSSTGTYSAGTYKLNCEMNVRSGADTSYSAIGVLSEGSVITVSKTSGRFGCINFKGKTAWVSLKYASKQ